MSGSLGDENGNTQSVSVAGSVTSVEATSAGTISRQALANRSRNAATTIVSSTNATTTAAGAPLSPVIAAANAAAAAAQARRAVSVETNSEDFKDTELIAKTHQKCLLDRIEIASDIFQQRLFGIKNFYNPTYGPPNPAFVGPVQPNDPGDFTNQKPYKYVSMASGKPYSFMNALTSVPGASKFLSMREESVAPYGADTPMFKIFKVVYDSAGKDRKVTKQIEIPFRANFNPEDERQTVSFLNMSYELGGTNSVSALSDIKFQMSIYFGSFDALLQERENNSETHPGKFKYIDLATKILNPLEDEKQSIDSKPTKKGKDLTSIQDGFFEIRVDLYYEPIEDDPELTDKELIEAIRNQKRSFFLTPIEPSFEFDDEGFFTFKIDYRARLAQVLNKERTFNILTGDKSEQAKIVALRKILDKNKEELKELQKKLKNSPTDKKRELIQEEIDLLTKDAFPNSSWYAYLFGSKDPETDKSIIDLIKEKLEEATESAAEIGRKKFINFLLREEKLYFAKVEKKQGFVTFDIEKTFDAMGAKGNGLSIAEGNRAFYDLVTESLEEQQIDLQRFQELEQTAFGLDPSGQRTRRVDVDANNGVAFALSEEDLFNALKKELGVSPANTSAENFAAWKKYPYLTEDQRKLTSPFLATASLRDAILRDFANRQNKIREVKKANQQGKGGQAASTTDQTQIEKQGAYYIPWFFLGDIVEFAAKESIENYVQESEIFAAAFAFGVDPGRDQLSLGYNPQPPADFLKKTKILLGPIDYKTSSGAPASFPASLAEMPVSFEFFKKWWIKNVVDPGKKTYSLSNFITDCMRDFTVEKFYLEFSSPDDVAKQLVPRKQIVDLPFNGSQPPIRAGERVSMTQLLSNLPNRNNTISNVEFCHYLVFYMMNSNTYDLTGDEEKDKKDYIPHLYYLPANTRSRVISVSFDPVDVEGLRQMKAFEVGAFDPLSELARVYNLSIEMSMNFCFFPGQYLFFNPIGFGSSLGHPTNPNSVSRKLGIGGYHLVTNVKGKYDLSSDQYTTTIEARWQTSGGRGSRALLAPQSSTGDGATPVTPTSDDATTQNIDLEELQE